MRSTERTVAIVAVTVMVAAGVIAASVAVLGATAQHTPKAIPSAPPPEQGWSFAGSFGSGGPDGILGSVEIPSPQPRIALHVVCDGPADVVVLVGTRKDAPVTGQGPVQAATFRCDGPSGSRVEFTAAGDGFVNVSAITIGRSDYLADTSYVIGIEVPGASPSPSN
jgi:hypothetical protein